MTQRALLLMAKVPVAGASKTRLMPVLEAEQAAELSACFLMDATELGRITAEHVPDLSVSIAGSPPEEEGFFRGLAPDLGFVPQLGNDLSERLDHVLGCSIEQGFDQVISINTDSPTLPSSLLVEAFHQLDKDDIDVVFGPAEDGGYYLIGYKQHHPRLVRAVIMSTPTVLDDSLAIAAELKLNVAILAPWYDVDEPGDLARLRSELASGRPCGEHTKRFLANHP